MSFDRILSASDGKRAAHTLQKLHTHKISRWALTGGLAIELHLAPRLGQGSPLRPLHDIDFLASSFNCIPETVGKDFLLRHIHPGDAHGKTMLQGVDPETAVRFDVFRAYGSTMERTSWIVLPSGRLRIVSLPDLAARSARLTWDLAKNVPVAPKYARDFLRLLAVVSPDQVESAWQQHRKPDSPETFADTARDLRALIASRPHLLIEPTYSTDVSAVCDRCGETKAMRLADAGLVLSLLGYC